MIVLGCQRIKKDFLNMSEAQYRTRVCTYVEADLVEWIKKEARKHRTTDAGFIRSLIARDMELDNDQ